MAISVFTVGPNNGARTYRSIKAVSRVLSGNGSNSLTKTIARQISKKGGYVGEVYVQDAAAPKTTKR